MMTYGYTEGQYVEATKVLARYRTDGGQTIEVREGWDCDYVFYAWTCPGCREEQPFRAVRDDRVAKESADAHARDCRAL
jgi:hypothetical protein